MPEGAETGEGKRKGAQTQPLFMVAHSHCQLSRLVSPTQELRPKAWLMWPTKTGGWTQGTTRYWGYNKLSVHLP